MFNANLDLQVDKRPNGQRDYLYIPEIFYMPYV